MKNKKLLLILFIFFLISGCEYFMVCSLNPFYLEKNVTLEDEIEGYWNANPINANYTYHWGNLDTLCDWKIRRFNIDGDFKDFYLVELNGNFPDTTVYKFKLVLFKVNNDLYADFSPFEVHALQNSLIANSVFFRVHALARVTLNNNGLRLSFLGDNTMDQMIGRKRVRLKHSWNTELDRIILTATSSNLTEMIKLYGNEKRYIDWDIQSAILELTPAKKSNQ